MHDVNNSAEVHLQLIIRDRTTTAQRFLALSLLLRTLVSYRQRPLDGVCASVYHIVGGASPIVFI